MAYLKNITKKILPGPVIQIMREVKIRIEGYRTYWYDYLRFEKYSLKKLRRASELQLQGKLIFHAHALEKGLSHEEIRLGFGRSALIELSKTMKAYQKLGYDRSHKAYINALSVLKNYIELHRSFDYDTQYLNKIFDSIIDEVKNCNSNMGGAVEVNGREKTSNTSKNFKELFLNRYSIREFANSEVDKSKIIEAINIATKAPSVCNRQPARARIIEDQSIIKQVLEVQGGLNGYRQPPVLLEVTSDIQSFLDPSERNQVFIDGGSFALALMLALEYQGLATCPLNAMFTVSRDQAMRKIINTPESESYIMFIAVGNFKDVHKAPKSFRYTAEDMAERR